MKDVRPSRTDAPDRLLEATSQILAERDTVVVSMADISKRSGLNHGLVRYYFHDKEGLLLALLKRDAEMALKGFGKLVESSRPPMQKLEAHIRGIARTYFRFPYINPLINYLQQSSDANAHVLGEVFVRPLLEYQNALLTEAYEAGLIVKIDPRFFFFSLVGACDQVFKSRRILHSTYAIEALDTHFVDQYAQFLIDTTLKGMRVSDDKWQAPHTLGEIS